jgi:peptide/nickel transport system permease protein
MLKYIARRILYMIPTLLVISIVTFVIIQLPPGDFLTSLAATLSSQGVEIERGQLELLKSQYGLDQPFAVQYFKWISGILLRGDFGFSFQWNQSVGRLIWGQLGLTVVLSGATLLFIWIIAFPIGIYSAVRKYSAGDYVATFFGFIGLATPSFLFALVLMYVWFAWFGQSVGGLSSPEYSDAPFSLAKAWDFLKHLVVPMIVLGTGGAASLIRIMRANLLDELSKPYVVTGRAKGLKEFRLLMKYPVRAALNPFVSTVGWYLPTLVSGATVVAIVLSLPTTGPLLYQALVSQDMYLAGSFLLMLSTLTVIGTLISDILLAALDPRIRLS